MIQLISLKLISRTDMGYMIQGNSCVFDSLEEAIQFIKKKDTRKKAEEGKRFFSEKLQRYFRSNWEIELAELLTELEIEFEYEPKRFYYRAEKESYLPDFYLTELDCWIEVKGWMDERSKKRIKLFRKYQKNEAFFLYEKEERTLILNDPQMLYIFIDKALRDRERRTKRGR